MAARSAARVRRMRRDGKPPGTPWASTVASTWTPWCVIHRRHASPGESTCRRGAFTCVFIDITDGGISGQPRVVGTKVRV
jgi:hypothetical protein